MRLETKTENIKVLRYVLDVYNNPYNTIHIYYHMYNGD